MSYDSTMPKVGVCRLIWMIHGKIVVIPNSESPNGKNLSCPKWSSSQKMAKKYAKILHETSSVHFFSINIYNKTFIQKPRVPKTMGFSCQTCQRLPTSTGCQDQLNDLRHWLPYQDAQWHASTLLASWKFPAGSFFLKPFCKQWLSFHWVDMGVSVCRIHSCPSASGCNRFCWWIHIKVQKDLVNEYAP